MDTIPTDLKQQLLGEDIVEWRCSACGATAYTLRSQGALLVKCSGNHGNTLVWMEQVTDDAPRGGKEGK